MFKTTSPPETPQNRTTDYTTTLTTIEQNNDVSESSVDPALIAEQERIWQEIQVNICCVFVFVRAFCICFVSILHFVCDWFVLFVGLFFQKEGGIGLFLGLVWFIFCFFVCGSSCTSLMFFLKNKLALIHTLKLLLFCFKFNFFHKQDRRQMERIRGDGGAARPRAIIPHQGSGRQPPVRTRSMPHPTHMMNDAINPKSDIHSVAKGGVAVLDPKKDKRKQTRKMKTAGGAVGGAVVGGLILGPVGVVLGAGGGAAISNKMAKSRDKRKQCQFEQNNFQKGADQSVASNGDGAFA